MDTLFDSLDQLPQLPKKNEVISKAGIAFGMGLTVLFYVIFLVCPEVLGMPDPETGVMIPIFQAEYIRSTWFLIVAFGILGIGRECVKLIDGTYTKRLLAVTTIVDVVSVVLAVIWLCSPQIINPAFVHAMAVLFADESVTLAPFVSLMVNFNYFFLICIIFALVVDFADVAWKYYRVNK